VSIKNRHSRETGNIAAYTRHRTKTNKINKKQTTQTTKMMSNIDPNYIIFKVLLRIYVTAKNFCTRNHNKFTELQCTGSDLHIFNYILFFRHVNM